MNDDDSPAGCFIVIGLIVVSIALGHMFGAAVGWLLFGATLLILGLLGTVRR